MPRMAWSVKVGDHYMHPITPPLWALGSLFVRFRVEQLAEGTLGFRANRSQASAKLSTRRRLHDSDNPTESWAVHSID